MKKPFGEDSDFHTWKAETVFEFIILLGAALVYSGILYVIDPHT